MPSNRVVHVRSIDDGVAARSLREGIAAIQAELEVTPDFPAEVEEAAAAAARSPRLPELDRTDLPFVTLDPEGAQDLDQALHLERDGDGYVVHYAIADVAAFVTAGDPVDVESHRRGETLYGADSRVPLHPPALSEDAASLFPDVDRPALLWTIRIDGEGHRTEVRVERAMVRSRARLDYVGVQRRFDEGTVDPMLALLKDVGELRLAREAERGGLSLPLPEQEIDIQGDRWHLEFRQQLPVETWNAQLSLLTGFAAASLMIEGRVGLLRTLPPADPRDLARLRRTAQALHIAWPAELDYAEFIRTLDPAVPAHAAMLLASTRVLRGAGYVGFDGEVPEDPRHHALAAEYAHVTAPLRRLGDRYAGEICLALCAGEQVPAWVLAELDDLPGVLQASGRLSSRYERAVLDLVEAGVLAPHVGESFTGVVVDVDEEKPTRGVVSIPDPAVEDRVISGSGSPLPLGTETQVRLTTADVGSRQVEFTLD